MDWPYSTWLVHIAHSSFSVHFPFFCWIEIQWQATSGGSYPYHLWPAQRLVYVEKWLTLAPLACTLVNRCWAWTFYITYGLYIRSTWHWTWPSCISYWSAHNSHPKSDASFTQWSANLGHGVHLLPVAFTYKSFDVRHGMHLSSVVVTHRANNVRRLLPTLLIPWTHRCIDIRVIWPHWLWTAHFS